MSKRQTVNSICSKEAELIGADNVLPAFLWLRYFIDAQELNVKEAVIYQDNHSDVLLDIWRTCEKGDALVVQSVDEEILESWD